MRGHCLGKESWYGEGFLWERKSSFAELEKKKVVILNINGFSAVFSVFLGSTSCLKKSPALFEGWIYVFTCSLVFYFKAHTDEFGMSLLRSLGVENKLCLY